LLWPTKEAQSEVCFAKGVVDEARKFIASAPRSLKDIQKVVPILERTEICFAENVAPYPIEKVVHEVVEIPQETVVKVNTVQFVSSVVVIKTCKPYVISHIVKKPPMQFANVARIVQTNSSDNSPSSIPDIASESQALKSFVEKSFNATQILLRPKEELEFSLENFMFGKFYCLCLLKCFWTYFSFSDFSFVAQRHLVGKCTSVFVDFLENGFSLVSCLFLKGFTHDKK